MPFATAPTAPATSFVGEPFSSPLSLKPAPKDMEPACKKPAVHKLILGEAIIGSLLILAAPFLGDYLEPVGGSKVLAVVLAVAHYAFHFIGGAILFKAGLDWGRHEHGHTH